MWPGVTCSRCTGRSPSLTCRSVRQTAQARTWTSSSPGAGAGTGFSTYLSGLVSIGAGWLTTQAFIISGLPTVIPYPYHPAARGGDPVRGRPGPARLDVCLACACTSFDICSMTGEWAARHARTWAGESLPYGRASGGMPATPIAEGGKHMRTSLREMPAARRGRALAAIGAAGALVAAFFATAPPAAASAVTATGKARPAAAPATKPRSAAAADSCAHPTFAHGLAQNVFSSNPSTWVRGEAWVQTTDDTDNDGVPDRIHVDITRPAETANPACGYKAPVILEESPYYAGIGPEFTWPVDYELGNPPPPRVPEPNWTARNTSPIISTIYESTWLPRGFAVVHAEGPGTGLSTGCPTGGDTNETEAGKAVVEWLNGKAPAFSSPTSDQQVYANWTNGNVGMTGTSYNGTLAEAVATTGVQGLKAIVPVSGISDWYDYYRANGMVRAPFTFQGEDLDVLADVVYSRADRSICRSEIDGLVNEEDRVTGDFSQYWAARDYMPDVRHVHAAVLMAHGNNDFNVMTKNMAQFYEAIKAQGVPHMLYFHQAGHGGAPPDVLMNLWFTRYLFDV